MSEVNTMVYQKGQNGSDNSNLLLIKVKKLLILNCGENTSTIETLICCTCIMS